MTIRQLFMLIAFTTGIVCTAQGQTVTWVGGVSTDWHTGSNWSNNNVPGAGATVNIPSVTNFPVITQNVTITSLVVSSSWGGGQLTVQNNATLTITNNFTVNGNGLLRIFAGAHVNHTGTGWSFAFTNNVQMILDNGTFSTNAANPGINAPIQADNSVFNFANQLTLPGGKSITGTGTSVNVGGNATISGTLTTNGPLTIGGTLSTNTSTNIQTASLTVQSTSSSSMLGALTVSGAVSYAGPFTSGSSTNIQAGSFSLNNAIGTILTGSYNIAGAFEFNNSTGNLTIGSNASLQAASVDINVTGSMTVSSGATFTASSGTIQTGTDFTLSSNTSVLTLTDVDLNIGNSFTTQSGTTSNITGGSLTTGQNLSFNGTVNLDGLDMDVANNFTQTGTFQADNYTLIVGNNGTINGTMTLGNGTAAFDAGGSVSIGSTGVLNVDHPNAEVDFFGAATVSSTGFVNLFNGRITFHQNFTASGSAIITVEDGNLNFGGNATFSNTASLDITGSGTVAISGNGTFQSDGTVNVGDGNLIIDGNVAFQNTGTMNAGSGNVTFSGDVTIANSGGTINAGQSTIIFEGGTFDNSGTFNPEESTFIFTGSGTQEIIGFNTDIEFFNLVVEDGAAVTANQNVTVLNNMQVESGGDYEHNNNTTLNVIGNVTGDPQIDASRPYLISIQIMAVDRIRLFFNIPLLPGSSGNGASNDANYALENPPSGYSLSATQISDTVVEITFTNFSINLPNEYFLVVNNLRSATDNTMAGQISTNHRKRFGGVGASIPQPLQLRYYPGGLASSNLSLWFDADDAQYLFTNTLATNPVSNLSTVAHWTDKSPAGNDAIQSVSSLRPSFESGSAFGGRPAVKFNNAEFMPFNGGFIAGSDYTIASVVQRTSGSSFNVYLGGADTGQNRNLHLFWNTSTSLNFHQYNNDLAATVPAYNSSDTGEQHLFRFESALANNNRALRRNGVQLNSGGNNSSLISWNGAALGRYVDTATSTINERFTGYIGEIIAYTRALNTAEQLILENYTATKWDRPLDASVLRYNAASGLHRRQLAGIGRHSSTQRVDQTVFTSGGMGLRSTTSGFLGSDGNYILIAHDGQTGIASFSTFTNDEILERWNRGWYLQKTLPGSDGSVEVYFNFDDYDLSPPDPTATYRLLFNPSEPDFFTQSSNSAVPSTVSISGNEVRFQLDSSNLSNGYYTIVRYVADAVADPDETTISASPFIIEADGASTSTITVQARYANGENVFVGGDIVTLSTTLGSIGSVSDNGDGTYTASLTSTNVPGTATVSGTINGDPIAATVQVVFENGVANAGETLISANPSTIVANGLSTSTITVVARDVFGVPLSSGGDNVSLSATAGMLSAVTDNNDGTYTATLTSSVNFETATITGTINSAAINTTAQVSFVAGAADVGTSTIFASPLIITADGVSTSTIIVQLRDAFGNPLQSGGDTVTLSTTAGSLGAVTDNNDGTYTAVLTSGVAVTSALITGTLNSVGISDNVTVQFVDYIVRTYYPGGLDNTDLQAWYDAADLSTLFTDLSGTITAGIGDNIARWDDKSIFSRHATQPAVASRPALSNTGAFGGRNSLVFNDTNGNHMIFDASFVEQSNYTLSFLVDRTSDKTRNIIIGGNGNATNSNLHLFWQGSNRFEHHHWGNNYFVTVPNYDNTSVPGEIIIANLNTAAATNRRNVWRNATLLGSETSNQTIVAGTMGTAFLGAYRPAVNQQFLQGRMGEAVMYNRPLTNTEFIILNNYKSAKWGVTLNTANQFFTAPSGFGQELVGIGRFNATDVVAGTVFTGGGLGLQTTTSDFLSGSGRYLMAAHNGDTGVSASVLSVASGLYETWERVWNMQKTNPGSDGNLTVYFDFSDYGVPVPSSSQDYALLFDPVDPAFGTTNASVIPATVTVSGTRVLFAVNSANILNGYYTIGRVIEPIYYSRQSGNWNNPDTWSLIGHDGPAAPNIPFADSEIIIGGDAGIDHTVTLTANVVLNTPGSLTVTDTGDGAGIFSTSTFVLSGTGSFILHSGAGIATANANGIATTAATGAIQTSTRTFSGDANYTYNGSTAQITGTGLPQNLEGVLRIDNSASVTLTRNTRVNGELVLAGGDLVISSGGSFIAEQIDYAGGQFRALRDVFIPASGTPGGWRLFSSPINTNYGNLFSELTTQGFTGSSLGTTHNGNPLIPSVLWYDETFPGTDNQRWRAPSNATDALLPGRGLFTYVFGDIPSDNRYNQSSVTLSVTGQENSGNAQGSVDFGVTWTVDGDDGWNLVGNPYLSTIDWDAPGGWTKSAEMNNTIYIWDAQANSGSGAFLEWNGSTGSLGNGFIKPFQGFWVKADDEDPELVVHREARTISTSGTFYRHRPDHTEIEIIARSGALKSSVFVTFTNEGRTGWDRMDAYRLRSLANDFIELYAVSQERDRLAINNLPRRFAREIEIPLDIDGMMDGGGFNGEVILSFGRAARVPADWIVELVDRTTGAVAAADMSNASHDIAIAGGQELRFRLQTSSTRLKTVVSETESATPATGSMATSGNGDFELTLPEGPYSSPVLLKSRSSESRFILRITPTMPDPEIPQTFRLGQNYPNPFNPTTTIPIELAGDGYIRLEIFDVTGRRLETIINEYLSAGRHELTWNAGRYASGIYIYRLTTPEVTFTKKMTLIK